MNWYVTVLKKYAVFSGRARRKEYWMFFLINILVSFLVGFVAGFIAGLIGVPEFALVGQLYALGVLIPGIAVTIRRLHDTGRSGWMWFLALIPLIGPIILLVFLASEGSPDENKYGLNPKLSVK